MSISSTAVRLVSQSPRFAFASPPPLPAPSTQAISVPAHPLSIPMPQYFLPWLWTLSLNGLLCPKSPQKCFPKLQQLHEVWSLLSSLPGQRSCPPGFQFCWASACSVAFGAWFIPLAPVSPPRKWRCWTKQPLKRRFWFWAVMSPHSDLPTRLLPKKSS